MKHCIRTTSTKSDANNIQKIFEAKFSASSLDLSSLLLNMGTKTEASAPSAKIRLNRLGNLKATLTLSAVEPAPNISAMKTSRARPRMRERKV